jgi:hypothetical protein
MAEPVATFHSRTEQSAGQLQQRQQQNVDQMLVQCDRRLARSRAARRLNLTTAPHAERGSRSEFNAVFTCEWSELGVIACWSWTLQRRCGGGSGQRGISLLLPKNRRIEGVTQPPHWRQEQRSRGDIASSRQRDTRDCQLGDLSGRIAGGGGKNEEAPRRAGMSLMMLYRVLSRALAA